MFRLPDFIDLDPSNRIGGGEYFDVHELPSLPGMLIKTIRADVADAQGFHKDANAIRRRRLLGVYGALARELNEFLVQIRRRGGHAASLPFARPFGFVQTSKGLGFVVERIAGRNGRIAPTLHDLCRSGTFRDAHLQALNAFFDRCKREHVVLGDIHARNIVFTDARVGKPEFVCVDGLGEKALIPIHALSRYFNGRRLERHRQRLLKRIEETKREAAVRKQGDPAMLAASADP